MFGAEIGQFPVPGCEIKRLRWETLAYRKSRVSPRFEFGGIFLTLRSRKQLVNAECELQMRDRDWRQYR